MDGTDLHPLVARGLSVAEIAAELGAHPRTVAAWLRENGLRTAPAPSDSLSAERPIRHCSHHGSTAFTRRPDGGWRCLKCRSEAVTRRRRRVKEALVAEAGGACALCAYSRCVAALEFHHLDPASKRFSVASRGVTRSLAKAREEAQKCVLLCANCHAEVEAGIQALQPMPGPADQVRADIPG